MKKLISEQYEHEILATSFGNIKFFSAIVGFTMVLRGILYAFSQSDSHTIEFFKSLIPSCIFGYIFAYVCPPICFKVLSSYPIIYSRVLHIFVCLFLGTVLVVIPTLSVVPKIEDHFFRGFNMISVTSLALYLAVSICKKSYLAYVSMICVYALYFFFVSMQNPNNIEFINKCAFSAIYTFSLIRNIEQRFFENFHLKISLAKKEALYRHFLEALPLKVIIYSAKNGIQYQNKSRCMHKIGVPEIIESKESFISLIKLFKGKDNNSLEQEVSAMYSKKEGSHVSADDVKTFEYTINVGKKCRIFHITILGPDLFEEVETIGLMLEDITKEKQLEEEKNARKNSNLLLYSLSHELKTPLNSIIGSIEQTINTFKLEKRDYMLQMAEKGKNSAIILGSTINDFLDLMKYNANKFVLHKENTIIRQFSLSICDICRSIVTHNIFIKFSCESNVPESIQLDQPRVQQVLINLLLNAIKYTKDGGVTLTVSAKEKNTGKTQVKFKVKDTGCGMNEEKIASLFLLKMDNENASAEGILCGLGLTISHLICKAMGSQIKVKSHVGVGSEFWFSLETNAVVKDSHEIIEDNKSDKESMIRSESSALVPTECPNFTLFDNKMHKSSLRRRKSLKPIVFIVDDTDMNRFVISKITEKFGIKIIECRNGLEAVSAFIDKCVRKKRKSLIFMDIEMPVMNGIEATIRIRKFRSEISPLIVAVTAFDLSAETR